MHAEELDGTSAETAYEFSFTSDADAVAEETRGQFSLQIGNQGEPFTLCIDDFSMSTAGDVDNLLPKWVAREW